MWRLMAILTGFLWAFTGLALKQDYVVLGVMIGNLALLATYILYNKMSPTFIWAYILCNAMIAFFSIVGAQYWVGESVKLNHLIALILIQSGGILAVMA